MCPEKIISLQPALELLFYSLLSCLSFGLKIDLFSNRSPEFYTARIEAKPNLPLKPLDKKTRDIANQMQTVFSGKKSIDWMSVRTKIDSSEILLKVKPSVLRQLKYKNILEKLRQIEKGDLLKNLEFNVLVGGPLVWKSFKCRFSIQ